MQNGDAISSPLKGFCYNLWYIMALKRYVDIFVIQ